MLIIQPPSISSFFTGTGIKRLAGERVVGSRSSGSSGEGLKPSSLDSVSKHEDFFLCFLQF